VGNIKLSADKKNNYNQLSFQELCGSEILQSQSPNPLKPTIVMFSTEKCTFCPESVLLLR